MLVIRHIFIIFDATKGVNLKCNVIIIANLIQIFMDWPPCPGHMYTNSPSDLIRSDLSFFEF